MVVIMNPFESALWSITGGDIGNNEETSNSQMSFINILKIHVKNKMAHEDLWRSYYNIFDLDLNNPAENNHVIAFELDCMCQD
jgi:hypothetical protein